MDPVRVLIVDADHGARVALQTLLTEEGYLVISAEDGEAGLQQIAEASPEIVLTDVHLPKRDGMSLLRAARAMGAEPSFVMMSASGNIGDAALAIRGGAAGYLFKPLALDSLLAALQEAAAKRKAAAADALRH